jgi:hypothetical protein
MDASTRAAVRKRANDRCEYCGLPQSAVAFTFQIEHIIAKQHRGSDDLSNLALAFDRCNQFKGTNLSGIDPRSGNIVVLFNPRRERWHDHFELDVVTMRGRTDVGRATVELLHMNAERRVRLRTELRGLLELTPPRQS